MSIHVGGRMEAKAPIRVTDGSDRTRMVGLFAIAVLLHAWMIHNSVMTARDSIGFARLAVNLANPSHGKPPRPADPTIDDGIARDLPDVLRKAQQPPGYPASLYAVYFVVRKIDPPAKVPSTKKDEAPVVPMVHDQILFSAQLASAIAMTMAVFPMYWLGRMLLDKNRSFAAVLIFQFLPVVARDTSDGLSEGLFFFGLSSSLALGVAGIRKQSIGRFLLCGLASGMTYLVRPEALAVAVAGLGVLAWLALTKIRPRKNMLACALALLAGTGIAAAPYMLLIGKLTNKPSGMQATEEITNPRLKAMGVSTTKAAGTLPLFAEWRRDSDDSTATSKALDAAKAIGREYLQASHYAVGILGLIGLFTLRNRLRSQPEWLLLLGAVAVHLMALSRVAFVQGYASERHLLSSAFVATYLAMLAIPYLFGLLQRVPLLGHYRNPAMLWVWVAILIAICIPSLLKPMHQNRVGFKKAGLFLAEQFEKEKQAAFEERLKKDPNANPFAPWDESQLTDPSEWVQFYAGRTYYMYPALTVNRKPGVEYGVYLPNRDHNDSRLNAVDYTAEMAADPKAEMVFSWPEGPEDKVKVKIYRRVNPPAVVPPAK